jgi:hypothetical protein
MKKEVVAVGFKDLSRHFKGGAEKNAKDLTIVSALAGIRTAEPQKNEVTRSKGMNHYTAALGRAVQRLIKWDRDCQINLWVSYLTTLHQWVYVRSNETTR